MILFLFACSVGLAQDTATTKDAAGAGAAEATPEGTGAADLPGQGQAITIVGADETTLPIPEPWKESGLTVPELVPAPPVSVTVPAIEPPSAAGDWDGVGGIWDGAAGAEAGSATVGSPPP
jgi:hypothetical protein